MDFKRIFRRLQTIRTNEVITDISIRLILGAANKKLGEENIDFSCPICINDALRKIRKLGENKFVELLKVSEEMKDVTNNPFNLKGTGPSARRFFFKNQWFSNDNLTLQVVEDWIDYNPSVLTNLLFSEEAAKHVKRLKVPGPAVLAWLSSNGKTKEDFDNATAGKATRKGIGNEKFKTTSLLAIQKTGDQAKEETSNQAKETITSNE